MEKLGLYFHIPYCKSKCAYCSFVSGVNHSNMREYHQSILQNVVSHSTFHKNKMIDSIYFGGGTPSAYFEGGLSDIVETVKKHYSVSGDCEITAEANPESLTFEKAKEYAAAGVNRVSIGLQSTNDKLLKAIGRPHKAIDFFSAYDNAVAAGFKNIGADLMLGLPGQEFADIENSIKVLYKLPYLRHLSVYSLKIEPNTPLYAQYQNNPGTFPDDDKAADMYDIAYKLLNEYGFKRYEVSNFAVTGYECRHNLKYWNLNEYQGFGVSAHSYYGGKRYAETDETAKFIAGTKPAVTELSDNDIRTEYIMLKLRQEHGIDLADYNYRFNSDLSKTDGAQFLLKYDLIIVKNGHLKIAHDKFYVMNSIILRLIG